MHTDLENRSQNSNVTNTNVDIPIFVINLTRDTERWAFQDKQRKSLQIPNDLFTRVDAIDGKKLILKPGNTNHLDTNEVDIYRYDNTFDVIVDRAFGKHKPSIIACTMSHITAIKIALHSGAELAVIAEDDVSWRLSPLWEQSLSTLATNISIPRESPFTIELFSNAWFPRKGLTRDNQIWGAQAYIVNRDAMKRLLNTVFLGPVGDNTMHLKHNKTTSNLSADIYVYDVIGSRWSIEPTYVYPYNCSHTSTLHEIYDITHIWHAHRSLKRALVSLQTAT
jgi:GR25 family glycosyltransferase involved in LPS biosynthesis